MAVGWPTKLALAPMLAAPMAEAVAKHVSPGRPAILTPLAAFSMPRPAKAPWTQS
jgi:hypothetical protein